VAGASDARGAAVAPVFLSYRREDTGQVVARLASELEAALGEGQVFYDRESLRGGDVWPERLRAAIQGGDVVVVLIGTGWLRAHDAASHMRRLDDPGDWVRREIETALGEAQSRPLRIVPVLVDGAEMPGERSRLPASIQAIARHQALPLRSATNAQWAADLAAIRGAIGADGPGQSREDARAVQWAAEHLQRLTARVAQRLAASAPVRTGDPAPRHISLSLVERRSEAQRPEPLSQQEVYDLQQLAGRDRARILVLGEGGAGKTSSLLHVAASAAERARVDPAAPVPVYVDLAQLMRIEDVSDLERLVADATPPERDGVSLQRIGARRPCLFLFDAFNEVPEQLHRNCGVALRRFVDTWGERHRYIVSSRAVPGVEPLAQPPASFIAYHLLRLTTEQVESYLVGLGLAALHERMPEELRDLARNPFMLVAIARTLAGIAEHDLPRNRGKLYQRVLETWMANEAAKRDLAYHYERVKAPVLSHLALRMTAAGQTALSWREIEPEIERLLEATYQRIRRRGGMPDDWTVDGCRDEIMADDVVQQTGDRVAFRHQSFQEYFAACWFAAGRADALVELTPRLGGGAIDRWRLEGGLGALQQQLARLGGVPADTTVPGDVSGHRLVPVLTMTVGLVADSTELVEALAARNPVIAAAAIASASRIDPAVRAALEHGWIEMLRDGDPLRRADACSCLCQVVRSPEAVRVLVDFVLADSRNTYLGAQALRRVSAVDELATQLIEAILALDEDGYRMAEARIGVVLGDLPLSQIAAVAFERWRAASHDDARRLRLETVLATLDRATVVARLRRFAADPADAARAAAATRALAGLDRWDRLDLMTFKWLDRMMELSDAKYAARRDQEAARLKDADVAELEVALSSSDEATRAGAARVIAARHIAIGDAVVDALLREDAHKSVRDLVAAAVDVLGAAGAAAKLVELSQRGRVLLRHVDASTFASLPVGEAAKDGAAASIRHQVAIAVADALGRSSRELVVTPSGSAGRSWRVTTRHLLRQQYEVWLSADGLDIYDGSMHVRAVRILPEIGPATLTVLREMSRRADPQICSAAITGLARLGDPELVDRLLELLRHSSDRQLVDAALEALVPLRAPQAIVLVEDLLDMTEDWSDVHPVWGRCASVPGWSDKIHRILVAIGADHEVAAAIDTALATGRVDRQLAALRERSRWMSDPGLGAERAALWSQASRGKQLVALALHDPEEMVRREATRALQRVSSPAVVEGIARALEDGDPAVRVAAADALCELHEPVLQARAQQAVLAIATSPGPPDLRRAAGNALSGLPAGLEPIYHPIRTALERGEPQGALDQIAGALEILPDNANLFWWRGLAQVALGLREEAAASLRRAFERQRSATELPPVLAELLIDLGDFDEARQVARHGVELTPSSADAHALLAWSCYRANAIEEAVAAARMACDLDPVHPRAIWILVLALLRAPAPEQARGAAEHALRVRQLLSPGLDTSFVATFTVELGALAADDEATAQLVAKLQQRLAAPVQSSL
jgi:tetratricopeptide (TPR) repeat protein